MRCGFFLVGFDLDRGREASRDSASGITIRRRDYDVQHFHNISFLPIYILRFRTLSDCVYNRLETHSDLFQSVEINDYSIKAVSTLKGL